MKKQRGVTLVGMLMVSALLVIVLLLAFKIVPVYIEHSTIEQLFRSMANDPTLRAARRSDLDRAWAARTTINEVKSLPAENIEYTKEGDGWLITAEYSVKVPLFGNVSAFFDFKASSEE